MLYNTNDKPDETSVENYLDIIRKSREHIISNDPTISVKDITLCHKKKVFSILNPVPITGEELYNYVNGQIEHEIIERHFMMFPNRFRTEMEIEYDCVKGRIDVYDKILNNVLDIKSSRSQQILLKPFKFHQEQVKYYMAMIGSEEGQILYHMNNFRKYLTFPIYMTAQELEEQLHKLKSQAETLRQAIKLGDASLVNGVYEDNEMKWMCNRCPYSQRCSELRNHDGSIVGAVAA